MKDLIIQPLWITSTLTFTAGEVNWKYLENSAASEWETIPQLQAYLGIISFTK